MMTLRRASERGHANHGWLDTYHTFSFADYQDPVHLYQIWLLPRSNGIAPSYEQKAFSPDSRIGTLRLVASPDGAEGSLTIHQDARINLSTLPLGAAVCHELSVGRHAWLQVLRGKVAANGTALNTSDGLAVSDEPHLEIIAEEPAEVMLFDLA